MEKLKRVVVKEELVALTGKFNESIVLNQMIYWSERVKDVDKFIEEEEQRARYFGDGSQETESEIKENLTNGWIYKTSDEMIEECMLKISRQTMDRIFKSLIDSGWLDRRRNPKYKWDKTWQYRVNLYKIQKDLMNLGYTLEGYSLPSNIEQKQAEQLNVQNEHSEVQNEHSSVHGEQSNVHGEQAIPEITSEITPEEKEEEIKNARANNIAYYVLHDYLTEKGIDHETANKTIETLIDRKIELFSLPDAKKQFTYMMDKLTYGDVDIHSNFAFYFVKGLEMRTSQSKANKQHQAEKLAEFEKEMKEKEKRDTSVYYNWLEE